MPTTSKYVHPGQVLHDEVMKPLGISRNKLARDLDVPVARISAIVSGRRSITADTALRLAKHFGMSAEFWMKLQAAYDLEVARAGSWNVIEPRVRVFKEAVNEGDEIVEPDAGAQVDAPAASGLPDVKSDETRPVDPITTFDAPLDEPSAPEVAEWPRALVSEPDEAERIESADSVSIESENTEEVESNDVASGEAAEQDYVGSAEESTDEPPPLELTNRIDSPDEEECGFDNEDLMIPAPPPSKRSL